MSDPVSTLATRFCIKNKVVERLGEALADVKKANSLGDDGLLRQALVDSSIKVMDKCLDIHAEFKKEHPDLFTYMPNIRDSLADVIEQAELPKEDAPLKENARIYDKERKLYRDIISKYGEHADILGPIYRYYGERRNIGMNEAEIICSSSGPAFTKLSQKRIKTRKASSKGDQWKSKADLYNAVHETQSGTSEDERKMINLSLPKEWMVDATRKSKNASLSYVEFGKFETQDAVLKVLNPRKVMFLVCEVIYLYQIVKKGLTEDVWSLYLNDIASVFTELDFEGEALNIEDARNYYRSERRKIDVPRCLKVVTKPVTFMVQELAPGEMVSMYLGDAKTTPELSEKLFRALNNASQMHSITALYHKRYHADLHAGNMIYDKQNDKLWFIDFGAYYRINVKELNFTINIAMRVTEFFASFLKEKKTNPNFDREKLIKDVSSSSGAQTKTGDIWNSIIAMLNTFCQVTVSDATRKAQEIEFLKGLFYFYDYLADDDDDFKYENALIGEEKRGSYFTRTWKTYATSLKIVVFLFPVALMQSGNCSQLSLLKFAKSVEKIQKSLYSAQRLYEERGGKVNKDATYMSKTDWLKVGLGILSAGPFLPPVLGKVPLLGQPIDLFVFRIFVDLGFDIGTVLNTCAFTDKEATVLKVLQFVLTVLRTADMKTLLRSPMAGSIWDLLINSAKAFVYYELQTRHVSNIINKRTATARKPAKKGRKKSQISTKPAKNTLKLAEKEQRKARTMLITYITLSSLYQLYRGFLHNQLFIA